MSQQFTFYLIHHSHTDIGYTDYQEKIEMHHIYFIKEVVDILNEVHNGKTEWEGFRWNCEGFWAVEKFLEVMDENYKNDFFKYVKSGEIGLSGNYLNLTDIVDANVLYRSIKNAVNTMKAQGIDLKSSMTADINGYSWGYADALYENGIENLMSCVHTHHGYNPLYNKQMPFYWQSPKGNKLLVWNGDHYMLGNELGITQQNNFEYTIRDGLSNSDLKSFEKAEVRLEAYVRVLREQNYPYDFVPISLSGLMTDNCPPSTLIIEFVNKYNSLHSQNIKLKMVTLDEFFDHLRQQDVQIPTYSGDWTDWWADGVGSTPDIVQHYREATRKLNIAYQLDPDCEICDKDLIDSANYNLMIYAEHTWGYSSSVSEPWHPSVNKLDLRKNLFALKANEAASRACNQITYANGETPPSLQHDFAICAINPHNHIVTDVIKVNLEILFGHKHFIVIDDETNESVPYQLGAYSRGSEFNVQVTLEPKQKKRFILKEIEAPILKSSGIYSPNGAEGVYDLSHRFENQLLKNGTVINPYKLENQFFKLKFSEAEGIVSIYDKKHRKELIRSTTDYYPFTPIYEVTSSTSAEQCNTRRLMGRNRKSSATERNIGKPCGITVLEDGAIYSSIEIKYELKGTTFCSILLTSYKNIPRIDVDFRCHKESVWSPENIYLALPFTTGNKDEEFWIEKTNAILRPRIDQLPGACIDFYAIQNGMCYCSNESSVIIATPDTPLISVGDIKAHEILLSGEADTKNIDQVYAWVMNNYWETNFKVDLGGFHQYRYTLLTSDTSSAEEAIRVAKETNMSVLGYASFSKNN